MSYCVVSCAFRQISVDPKIGYTRGGQLYEVRLPHLQEATQARAMHVSVKWNIGYNAANCLRKWLVLFISDSTTATNPLTTTTTTTTTTKTSFPYRLVSCSCSSDCFGHYTSPFFRKKKLDWTPSLKYTTYILHITATCFGYLNVAIVRLYRELYKVKMFTWTTCALKH